MHSNDIGYIHFHVLTMSKRHHYVEHAASQSESEIIIIISKFIFSFVLKKSIDLLEKLANGISLTSY